MDVDRSVAALTEVLFTLAIFAVGIAIAIWSLLPVVAAVVLLPGLVIGPSLDASVFVVLGQGLRDGALPYVDLWDHKPQLAEHFDKDLPESIRMGQRITTMTSGQARFPLAPSKFNFQRCGRSGVNGRGAAPPPWPGRAMRAIRWPVRLVQ